VEFESAENAGRTAVPVHRTKKPRRLREPSPQADIARAGDPDPHGSRDPVEFKNYAPSDELNKKLTNAADMSGGESEGGLLMMSFNWSVDVSTDDGASWKRLDPTTVFPAVAGFPGFCCDQVVTYVPSIDHFVWFMQHDKDGNGQGAFRLATASSSSVRSDPAAWTYWDFVGDVFG